MDSYLHVLLTIQRLAVSLPVDYDSDEQIVPFIFRLYAAGEELKLLQVLVGCSKIMHTIHQLKSKPASAFMAYNNFCSICSLLHHKGNNGY